MTETNVAAYLMGRHAIVTGGVRGIGAAIAATLARLGAQVTVMARTAEDVTRSAAQLSTEFGVETRGIVCDVTDSPSIETAFEMARRELGAPYILVNNAGQGQSSTFLETSRESWDQLLAVNLTGAFLCTQQVLPAMLEAREGRIINIASTAGLKGYARTAAYCASKHGLVGLTRSLAVEIAKSGITVNAVCPGYTETDMAKQAIENLVQHRKISEEEAREMLVRGIPRGRLTTPDEVASVVAWLCSPQATAMTGQSLAVAGGEVM
ncbi:MAG TPA: 3-oxoacyl-ACP reductase family protein [Gemmatimonadaceae bacterium]|nr:3-oxoacyl-ACP reductase family protein [Gemmatimonadaceae bacterium]